MSSCVSIMCVNNTAKVSSPCRISRLLSKPPISSPRICQSQRSRNMRIHSSQDCLRKVFSMASGLPQLSATASSKLQLRGGAKMWHSTCSISPKSDKRQFFDFTGFSFKKYDVPQQPFLRFFVLRKISALTKVSSETPPSMLLSLRLTKDLDKEEMTSR